MPIRLPFGAWIITYNDAMSLKIRKNEFEDPEQKFLQKFLKEDMTFFDIGTNFGIYSLLASKKVGKNGNVVSFEPSPRELKRLYRNLKINLIKNVRVEPIALSNCYGKMDFYVCMDKETGCNSMGIPDVNDRIKKIQVPVTTLDNYMTNSGLKKIDFIKIDVEGSELNVFRGGLDTLKKYKPVILCELADIRTNALGYQSYKIYEYLEELGYKWFSLNTNCMLKFAVKKTTFNDNLIAIPVEKINDIKYLIDQ